MHWIELIWPHRWAAKLPAPKAKVTQLSQRDSDVRWDLEATYAVHLRLIGKPIVDFLLD